MADISEELLAISDAVYGEQVRSSIIDALTKINAHVERISVAKTAGVYTFRGSVSTAAELPISGITVGDCYYITSILETYAWNGTVWSSLGGVVDASSSDSSSSGSSESSSE